MKIHGEKNNKIYNHIFLWRIPYLQYYLSMVCNRFVQYFYRWYIKIRYHILGASVDGSLQQISNIRFFSGDRESNSSHNFWWWTWNHTIRMQGLDIIDNINERLYQRLIVLNLDKESNIKQKVLIPMNIWIYHLHNSVTLNFQ